MGQDLPQESVEMYTAHFLLELLQRFHDDHVRGRVAKAVRFEARPPYREFYFSLALSGIRQLR